MGLGTKRDQYPCFLHQESDFPDLLDEGEQTFKSRSYPSSDPTVSHLNGFKSPLSTSGPTLHDHPRHRTPRLKILQNLMKFKVFQENCTPLAQFVNIPYSFPSHPHHGVHMPGSPCSAPVCRVLPPCPLQFLPLLLLAPSRVPPTEGPCLPSHPPRVQEFRARLRVCGFAPPLEQ